jgi:membrane protease subunit (stomatin/prohibitin family)
VKLVTIVQNQTTDPSVVISKFEPEDFENFAKLVVNESEEAIFVRDGLAVGVFDGGQYVLDTNNYPWLSWALRKVAGKGSDGKVQQAFTCKVYFVSRNHHLALDWGTTSPIQLRDPVLNLQTSIQGYGNYTVRVEDSKKLLVKLVGNARATYTDQDLRQAFRGAFGQYINDAIAGHIMSSGREVLAICADRTKLAAAIEPELRPLLSEYGLVLEHFYVESLQIPENDPNRQVFEQAFATRGQLNILGADWQRVQARDVLTSLAQNPGAGGVAAIVGGGFGAGNVFGGLSNQLGGPPSAPPFPPPGATTPTPPPNAAQAPVAADATITCSCGVAQPASSKFCSACGQSLTRTCSNCGTVTASGAKFCPECGTAVG